MADNIFVLFRKNRGFSVRQAAKTAGVTPSAWYSWETGTRKAPHWVLIYLHSSQGVRLTEEVRAREPFARQDLIRLECLWTRALPLADYFRLPRQTWYRWKTGKSTPSATNAARLRALLDKLESEKNNCEI